MRARGVRMLLAVLLAAVLAGVAAPGSLAATDDRASAGAPAEDAALQGTSTEDPALRGAPADRLERLADALRRSPLAVDPELDWQVDPAARRSLLRLIRGSDVPVLVAVLPLLTEDESGGDAERVLRTLQQRLKRDAMYVVVSESGEIEESPFGIRLRPDVPFEVRYPPIERRREEDERPDPFASVPSRLAGVVRALDTATEQTTPAPGVTTGRRLSTLPSQYDDADEDDGSSTAVAAIVLALVGAGIGLVVARRRIRREDARLATERREAEQRERKRQRAGAPAAGERRRRRRRRRNRR